MDFVNIEVKQQISNNRKADFIVKPEFVYAGKDIVCKGGMMYAYWDGHQWISSRNELRKAVDHAVLAKRAEVKEKHPDADVVALTLNKHSSGQWQEFGKFEKQSDQSDILFNQHLLFADDTMTREDYATHQLSYTPTQGEATAWDELMSVLYADSEKEKIMWFMGALLTDSMSGIQKFLYLYGGKGTGKGTVIKIFKLLFEGYYANIDLDLLTGGSEFATGQIVEVPLLIDDDSDISRIKKDTNLLKLTAHEPLSVNAKYKTTYDIVHNGLLIAASNERFKVKHVDAGIVRRGVVAEPTKNTVEGAKYKDLMNRIKFELPYIAQQAIDLFLKRGPYFYDDYIAVDMMEDTDYMYAFMREYGEQLGDLVTLKSASDLYRMYLEEIGFETNGYKRKLKMGLKHYYMNYYNMKRIDGVVMRNVFEGLKREVIFPETRWRESGVAPAVATWVRFGAPDGSAFDRMASGWPAQLATDSGIPKSKWESVKTTLSDVNTSELHYVRVPENHIVIDFDLKDETGEKNLELNLARAHEFPATYAEVSKSGQGLHLHYIYDGDVNRLSSLYDDDIEIKVYKGGSSLRRKLSRCNDLEVAHISTGLPLKEENKRMYESIEPFIWTERKMRTAVMRNLRKEIHANTKPSMDFIKKIFDDAKAAGVEYDLTDLRGAVVSFASRSTNKAKECMKIALSIPYTTIEEPIPAVPERGVLAKYGKHVIPDKDLYFYDIEIFPNLFVVCYKRYGEKKKTRLINPTKAQIEAVLQLPLIGFYNRKYDNHMMYGAVVGETPYQLFQRSQKLVGPGNEGTHMSAYNASYMDIYEVATKKQSLKKWEAEMGILHDELELPWNKPVPEDMWERVADYCCNDVDATEAVFNEIRADYVARQILSALSGLPINAKTQEHTARILFGNERRPQDKFVYTDLSEMFPGYKFEMGKSEYRGEDPGEGGYVYSEPGIYTDVALLDIASMHPTSAIQLNYFGPYTQLYADLKQARIYIKHRELDKAGEIFEGKLKPFLDGSYDLDALAYALKIAINIVYGMTSASYENKFRNNDNVDNIVAKRGALFMIDLKHAVQEKGFTVAHIKTDSIKIPNATPEIIEFVMEMGRKYGYEFEHEHTYKKMALVNKSVYIAQLEDDKWEPTGAQFAQPYVYKKLFSHEPILEEDFKIIKSATAPIYLGERFVGKVAPVYCSVTGADMWRIDEEKDKKGYVTGTKGYAWKLFEEYAGKRDINMQYYDQLCIDAVTEIDGVGDIDSFMEVPEEYKEYLLPF